MDRNAYDQILNALINERGWDEGAEDTLRNYANAVAHVESNNRPDAVQFGSGIGRGKYQFENARGSGRNKTAINRLKRFIKKNNLDVNFLDLDRMILDSEDPDFSQLSSTAQDAVFIADMAEGKMPVGDLVSGELTPQDAWIDYHWAGGEEQEPIRRQHWQDVISTMGGR